MLTPLLLVQVYFLCSIGQVVILAYRGIYSLTISKKIHILLYIVSLAICIYAEGETVVYADNAGSNLRTHHRAAVVWIEAASIFLLCGVSIAREECIQCVERRCFSSPLLLTRTDRGWGTLPRKRVQLMLIGSVETNPSFLRDYLQFRSPPLPFKTDDII